MLQFLKQFGLFKTKQLAREATSLIATLDTKAAMAADLRVMEQDLDQAGKLIAELRASHNREVKEFEAVEQRYNQRLAAAEALQGKLDDAATSEADRTGIQQGLSQLVDELEKLEPEIAKEKQDVVDAAALLKEAEAAYTEKATAIKAARSQMESAERDLRRAEIDADRAKAQAENAARVAGLRQGDEATGLRVGLNAMTEKAQRLRAEAEASRLKAGALGSAKEETPDNPHLAAALAAAEGKPQSTVSATDRLKALRERR